MTHETDDYWHSLRPVKLLPSSSCRAFRSRRRERHRKPSTGDHEEVRQANESYDFHVRVHLGFNGKHRLRPFGAMRWWSDVEILEEIYSLAWTPG